MSANNSKIVNYLIRMVVPMRREFGLQLDVNRFLDDSTYAGEMLETALSSQNPLLKEQAQYVQTVHFGKKADVVSTPAPPLAGAVAQPPEAGPSVPTDERRKKPRDGPLGSAPTNPNAKPALTPEEEMKALILKKYTSGLR